MAFKLPRPATVLFAMTAVTLYGLLPQIAIAASEFENEAFPERFMFRLVSYNIDQADTDIAVLKKEGIGAGFSFTDDLGGDSSASVPRIDAYYRFNQRHRIEFTNFSLRRNGRKLLEIEVDLEDQTYNVGDTVVSEIETELIKIGYGYTFYHSPRVELSFTAGLNITKYDFQYALADGSEAGDSRVTAPLPMFGLRMGFAITPEWSLQFMTESFYIEIEDTYSGAFTSSEVDIQYRVADHFVVGAGIARFNTDLTSRDEDWRGRIADSHRGIAIYGSFYY